MDRSIDAAAGAALRNYLCLGFATFVVMWMSQLYFKKTAKPAKDTEAAKENDDVPKEGSEEEDEDLFSDQDYPIKDNYGFTDGAFKMVITMRNTGCN